MPTTGTASSGGNYSLLLDSVAINNGLDLSSTGFSDDYDGISRPKGLAWDIGAYEYVSATPPPDTTPPSAPTGLVVE